MAGARSRSRTTSVPGSELPTQKGATSVPTMLDRILFASTGESFGLVSCDRVFLGGLIHSPMAACSACKSAAVRWDWAMSLKSDCCQHPVQSFCLCEEQDQMVSCFHHGMVEVFYRWHAILNQGEISYCSSARCKPIDLNKCILCQKKK